MPHYDVYLEVHPDGRALAHVPALPGCVAWAPAREDVVRLLGSAVDGHHAWLRRHGEAAPHEGVLSELVIVDEYEGGPFDPRHTAALLPADHAPLSAEEVAHHARLMEHARQDLLDLVSHLPAVALNWKPQPDPWTSAQPWSIADILRHIGNAERWYISRIVPLEELPEFERADELALIDYLALARRVSVEKVLALTDEQRSAVVTPTAYAKEPEPWNARKMLRRYLEHELEHIGQVRELLAAQRMQLVSRLLLRRAELLEQLTGLPAETLTSQPVFEDSTAANILAHIASWDEFFAARLAAVRQGRAATIEGVDVDFRNALTAKERKNWGLDRSLAAFISARQALLAELNEVAPGALYRPIPLSWGSPTIHRWLEICVEHDEEHTAHLAAWRKTLGPEAQETWHKLGPKSLLETALHARRETLLAHMALVPPRRQETQPVAGDWTLKDLTGHIADWEREAAERIRGLVEARPPASDYTGDAEAFNAAHHAARTGQPWETGWNDFRNARRELLALLLGLDDAALNHHQDGHLAGTPYGWFFVGIDHDREHTDDLRRLWEEEPA